MAIRQVVWHYSLSSSLNICKTSETLHGTAALQNVCGTEDALIVANKKTLYQINQKRKNLN